MNETGIGTGGGTKVLTVGLITPVAELDPEQPTHEVVQILRQFLEPLFDYFPSSGRVEPVLFEGPLEPDPRAASRTLRARLRPDVQFSDGQRLTAGDVVATLRGVPVIQQWATVSADGDDVVFTMKQRSGAFEPALTHPQCYVAKRVGGRLLGTGAFVPAAGTPSEHRLVRNPHFRRKVALDEVRFRVYPPDEDGSATALVDALNRGEVDLTTVLPRDEATRATGVRKAVLPTFSTAMLALNVQSPKLANPLLRRALAHAIDRGAFAADAYENPIAFTARSLLPRAMAPAQDGLDFDFEKARSLLAQAGGPPPPLRLVLIWGPRPYLPSPTRAAAMLAAQLQRLGVTLDVIRTRTPDEFYQRLMSGGYDLCLAGYYADTVDPCDFLETCLASDRVPAPGVTTDTGNYARLRSPAMDQALAAYRTDRTAERLDAVMRLVTEEAPLVPLMYGSTCTISSFRVANLKPSPLASIDFSELDLTD